jgi:colanic acid/amylovoran biosynthesis protein
MRILITNTVILNGGEAATVTAIVRLLRDLFGADTEIVVYEQQPDIAARYYPELTFRKLLWYRVSHEPRIRLLGRLVGASSRARFLFAARRWQRHRGSLARFLLGREERRDLELYAGADLVVSTGGTYLVEKYDLRPRIFDYRFCMLLDKPLIFFTQSLGPFANPDYRSALRAALDHARLVLLRDEESLRHVADLGVANRNVHVSADAVFALGGPRAGSASGERPAGRRLTVAVSVRYWRFFEHESPEQGMARYRSLVGTAVSHLVRNHAADVVFLSTCQGIREYWADDSRVAGEIMQTLDPDVRERASVDGAFHAPEAMIDVLGAFDLVIATRFHMAILALLAGRPTLAIGYEFKTQQLFARMGLGDWVQDIEVRDASAFCRALDACIVELGPVRATIERGVAAERGRALAAGELVRRAVDGAPHGP